MYAVNEKLTENCAEPGNTKTVLESVKAAVVGAKRRLTLILQI